jgi:hypothetical protein
VCQQCSNLLLICHSRVQGKIVFKLSKISVNVTIENELGGLG